MGASSSARLIISNCITNAESAVDSVWSTASRFLATTIDESTEFTSIFISAIYRSQNLLVAHNRIYRSINRLFIKNFLRVITLWRVATSGSVNRRPFGGWFRLGPWGRLSRMLFLMFLLCFIFFSRFFSFGCFG